MLGLSLAAAVLLVPQNGWSGGYEAGASASAGPRWSNNHHIMDGIAAGSDCLAPSTGRSADYIPGRNARGEPVPPADSHTGRHAAPPVELEIELGRKRIGGRRMELGTGPMIYDPATGTLNGAPLPRDCAPRLK